MAKVTMVPASHGEVSMQGCSVRGVADNNLKVGIRKADICIYRQALDLCVTEPA